MNADGIDPRRGADLRNTKLSEAVKAQTTAFDDRLRQECNNPAYQQWLIAQIRLQAAWQALRKIESSELGSPLAGQTISNLFVFLAERTRLGHPVNLEGADLSGLDLSCVPLWQARLKGASLRGSTMAGSCLFYADLTDADLREANLVRTRFENAKLRGVKWTGAKCEEARLWSAEVNPSDLDGVQGISKGSFEAPSFGY